MCFLIGVCLYLSSYRAITDSNNTNGKLPKAVTSGKLATAETVTSKSAKEEPNPAKSIATSGTSAKAATLTKVIIPKPTPKKVTLTKVNIPEIKNKHRKWARRYYKSRKYKKLAETFIKLTPVTTSGKLTPVTTSGKLTSVATSRAITHISKKKKRVVKLGNTYVPIHIHPEKDPKMNIIQLSEVVVPVSMVNLVNGE